MSQPSGPAAPVTSAKAVVALIGGLLTTLVPILQQVSGFLPQPWPAVITGLIALLTVFGVYQVPNKAKAP